MSGVLGSFMVNFPNLDTVQSVLDLVYWGSGSVLISHRPTYFVTYRNKEISLSARQVEVILCWLAGLTMKEIGERLFISERTVETHLKNIRSNFQHEQKAYVLKHLSSGGLFSQL